MIPATHPSIFKPVKRTDPMSYILQWKNPAVDPGKTSITVNAASTVSNAASLTFTGKGAASYAKIQQENLMRLLEHFADGTAPLYPTVGQLWYDTTEAVLKVCTSTAPITWKSIAGLQVTAVGAPAPAGSVGDIWVQRAGPLSGFIYTYTGMGRFPIGSTNGGWSQMWPQPMEVALREEYDEVKAIANDLLLYGTDEFGSARAGNGAFGRLFTALTDFSALDADLDAKATATPDGNVTLVSPIDLRAQPYSGDWDTLLSACRWAVERLDVPATMWQDVSPMPFVQDGRQPPAALLTGYSDVATEPRFPTTERRSGRRYGLVTLSRLFVETVNVLQQAAANRYSLRGMSGTSGAIGNTSFSPEVAQWTHCSRTGPFTGGTGEVSTLFRWSSDDERNRFVLGGSAIEVVLAHSPSSSPADAEVDAFIAKHSRFRITADKVRALNGSGLAVAPFPGGLKGAIDAGATTTLAAITEGPVTLTLQCTPTSGNLAIYATLNTSAGVTGTVTVTYRIIKDCTAYGPSDTDLFPSPTLYVASTDALTTSGVFSNVPVSAPPVANFSASATSAPAGSSVVLTWTGTGGPSLVEWDIDGVNAGTGPSFTLAGLVAGRRYTVRVRATNSSGTDVLTRPAYITVT